MQAKETPDAFHHRAARPRLLAFLAALLAAALLLASAPARAQLIDAIEVNPKGREAQILIRFGTTVQYLRHAPPGKGRLLVVEFRVTGPLDSEIGGRLVSETRVSPKSDLVPAFVIDYVPARNALTVEFKSEVQWRVSGSGDGRSNSIFVPLPPDKIGKAPAPVKPRQSIAHSFARAGWVGDDQRRPPRAHVATFCPFLA